MQFQLSKVSMIVGQITAVVPTEAVPVIKLLGELCTKLLLGEKVVLGGEIGSHLSFIGLHNNMVEDAAVQHCSFFVELKDTPV